LVRHCHCSRFSGTFTCNAGIWRRSTILWWSIFVCDFTFRLL
jgi:hypothetical protein